MGRASKLTPELIAAALAHNAAGWSQRKIARWLKTEHAVTISQQSLGEHLRREFDARGKVARPIVEAHLLEALPADLKRLQRDIQRMDRVIRDAKRRNTPTVEIRAVEQRRKLIETRVKMAGGDQPASDEFITSVIDLTGLALADEDAEARMLLNAPDQWLAAKLPGLLRMLGCAVEALAHIPGQQLAADTARNAKAALEGTLR